MSSETQQRVASKSIAAAVGPTSTPTPVLDGTRRVSIGPVARKLAKRRHRSPRWLPRLGMALAVLACGFIVHTAVKQFENNSDGFAALSPLDKETETKRPKADKFESEASSQVRTVIELVGAFENLKTQDAENENPLDLPNENSPTTPVAVYAPEAASSHETEDFLSRINMGPKMPRPLTPLPTQPADEDLPTTEDTELVVAEPEDITPEVEEAPAPETAPAESVAAAENVPETATETSEELDNLTADDLLSEVAQDDLPTQDLLDESNSVDEEAPQELVVSEPEAIEPADELIATTETDSDSEISPSEAATADATDIAEKNTDDEVADTVAEEVITATEIEPTTEIAPVTEESPEVAVAIANYEKALADLANSPADRLLSRRYYTALAALAHVGHTHDSTTAAEALNSVYADPTLFDLASSAASSWIKWPKRKSPGVVVAGKVQSVTESEDGIVIGMKTNDRRSSIVAVVVVDEDQDVTALSNRVGEDLVFSGVVTDEQRNGSPLVIGRPLTQ